EAEELQAKDDIGVDGKERDRGRGEKFSLAAGRDDAYLAFAGEAGGGKSRKFPFGKADRRRQAGGLADHRKNVAGQGGFVEEDAAWCSMLRRYVPTPDGEAGSIEIGAAGRFV